MTTTTSQGMLFGADILRYALAGNATLTLVSKKSGARFTFRILANSKDGPVSHFVSLLSGESNETDFEYLGHVIGGHYRHGSKSRVLETSPSARAIKFFFDHIYSGHPDLEVWHEGRCGKCGRKLTVPESIQIGLGPECAGRLVRAA